MDHPVIAPYDCTNERHNRRKSFHDSPWRMLSVSGFPAVSHYFVNILSAVPVIGMAIQRVTFSLITQVTSLLFRGI